MMYITADRVLAHFPPFQVDGLNYSMQKIALTHCSPAKDDEFIPWSSNPMTVDQIVRSGHTVVLKPYKMRNKKTLVGVSVAAGKTYGGIGYIDATNMEAHQLEFLNGGLYQVTWEKDYTAQQFSQQEGIIICHYIGRADDRLML